jgi:hypothetical protein
MPKEDNHRNLIVWQHAQALSHQMIQLTKRLPQSWANAVSATIPMYARGLSVRLVLGSWFSVLHSQGVVLWTLT